MRRQVERDAAHRVHVAPVVPWLLPYVVIWGGTAAGVRMLDLRESCTGFCAVLTGLEAYALLLCAAALSVVVAAAEVLLNR